MNVIKIQIKYIIYDNLVKTYAFFLNVFCLSLEMINNNVHISVN